MLLSFSSFPKQESGIYLSVTDYRNNKLAYETNSRIRLNNSLVNESYITVIQNGEKKKLNKTDVYGYMDADKKVYRFCKGGEYLVAETGDAFLYTQIEKIAQSKGYKVAIRYFFSKSADSDIFKLTPDNVKEIYGPNGKIPDILDKYLSNSATGGSVRHTSFK